MKVASEKSLKGAWTKKNDSEDGALRPMPVGLGALSPAGGLWAPELSSLPTSARSPRSTAPGSLSLVFRV